MTTLHHQGDKVTEFTRMALRGCDLGEKIALSHQKRPCFKKIDSLCARLKQDLVRNDGVLANINSQGVAWAVKDFIFVFTRIINAWIIIKGYANNSSEGLSKVRSALSSNFHECFNKWQESTSELVQEIIKSFLSLDNLVQTQRTVFNQKNDIYENSTENLNVDKQDSFEDSYSSNSSLPPTEAPETEKNFSTVLANSEEVQVKHLENGTYFKTGVYNPLRKKEISGAISVGDVKDIKLTKSAIHVSQGTIEVMKNENELKKALNKDHIQKVTPHKTHFYLKSIWHSTVEKEFNDMSKWTNFFLNKILNLQEGEYFFNSQFIENYVSSLLPFRP